MVIELENRLNFCDYTSPHSSFLEEVTKGLSLVQKEIPCKYFYDENGSYLFERICCLKEYYLTRVEIEILKNSAAEIAELIGKNATIVEYGSGASVKTKILLNALKNPARYVPIDISKAQLAEAGSKIAEEFDQMDVCCICADYLGHYYVPKDKKNTKRVVFFPGSTIGNFKKSTAIGFLERITNVCGKGGALIIGVDLIKDVRILEKAYNDEEGITALFNKNLLTRINSELGFDFDLNAFNHKAIYNEDDGCIEMHLVSKTCQRVRGDGQEFCFEKGESILTERSHKYTLEGFENLALKSGFKTEKVWLDKNKWFSLQYLTC